MRANGGRKNADRVGNLELTPTILRQPSQRPQPIHKSRRRRYPPQTRPRKETRFPRHSEHQGRIFHFRHVQNNETRSFGYSSFQLTRMAGKRPLRFLPDRLGDSEIMRGSKCILPGDVVGWRNRRAAGGPPLLPRWGVARRAGRPMGCGAPLKRGEAARGRGPAARGSAPHTLMGRFGGGTGVPPAPRGGRWKGGLPGGRRIGWAPKFEGSNRLPPPPCKKHVVTYFTAQVF